ncbi:MAG: ComEC/Rec2 family competence protein [Bacteroidota bacterium]
MPGYRSDFWKKAPFVKLLLAMMVGILLQWQLQLSLNILLISFLVAMVAMVSFFFIPFFNRFRFAFINGIIASLLFFFLGAILVWGKDIRNKPGWLGNFYQEQDAVIATLDEPLVEKTKSLKAIARVSYLVQKGRSMPVEGKVILYFKKDSSLQLEYGSQIIFRKNLQEIKNSGNPGGFNYKRYSLFQGITHQVYLQTGEYEVLNGKKENRIRKFIYGSREFVLNILRKNIRSEKELGLAEALLIGYKDDLEKSLVQSYTNTGVVHIIAISGLHLGLIYWLLALLLKPLKKKKTTRWLSPVLIISGLWLFSLLAGAQPSILRAALMFTCIVLGESLSKKTSVYNTMAVSAFIILCINPYWLWDVGFQLSYAAVLSIIIFMRPVYNWFYIKNKLLDIAWKMTAVTLAAQVLTVPLSIYHFHQFPNLFILTNFLAVPLSSVILLGEILLCVISFIPAVALGLGQLLSWLIRIMNSYIERIETISFSLWDGLEITLLQAVLLVLFTVGAGYWLMERSTRGIKLGLLALLGFAGLRSFSFIQHTRQEEIIVYNISQKKAIDILQGKNYFFIGDSDLLTNDFARNFHLKPSRTLNRVKEADALDNLLVYENYLSYRDKHILLLDESIAFAPQESKPAIDLLVLSKNPKVYMKKLAAALEIRQVVFDGSVPAWKANYWKKDCDSLHIPWYDVTIKGAFVMKLQ